MRGRRCVGLAMGCAIRRKLGLMKAKNAPLHLCFDSEYDSIEVTYPKPCEGSNGQPSLWMGLSLNLGCEWKPGSNGYYVLAELFAPKGFLSCNHQLGTF